MTVSLDLSLHILNEGTKPDSTVKTAVLTAPNLDGQWYTVIGITICASDGNAGTADIFRYVASTTTEYQLEKNYVVPAAAAARPDLPPIVLRKGDELRVTPSRASQHVDVSYVVGRSNPSAASLGKLERSQ